MSRTRPPPPGTRAQTYAFRIGYWGEGFAGYARQPGAPTVEGTLRTGILQQGLLAEGEEGRFRSASRTDGGVHALGNVISFPTTVAGHAAARALDAIDPRIFCLGYAEVPEDFEPRHARERWYRYVAAGRGASEELWRRRARLFEGVHDFESFSRKDKPPRPTRILLGEVQAKRQGEDLVLDFRAPRFLWNQVRKIVGSLDAMDRGRLLEREVRAALDGKLSLQVPVASPEPLVLMDVAYDFAFTPTVGVQQRHQRFLEEIRLEATRRQKLATQFSEAIRLSGATERANGTGPA